MTIFALSSGQGISGISVIRISGPETKTVSPNLLMVIFQSRGWQH